MSMEAGKILRHYLVNTLNQKCIRSTIMDISEARRQEKIFSKEMNLVDGDIVICSTGAGTLGRVGKVFGEYKNTTFDSHVTLVRASQNIGKQYLFHAIKEKQEFLQNAGRGSTNQLELNKSVIGEISLVVPQKHILDMFESMVQNIHMQISLLNSKLVKLKEQRSLLLPKLFHCHTEF